jgi:hypothetical protein
MAKKAAVATPVSGVESGTKQKDQKPVVFLKIRNNIHVLRITAPCEIELTELPKWSEDKKGVIIDSFLKLEVYKGTKEARVPAKRFIFGKSNEKLRFWGMDVEFTPDGDKTQEV